MFNLEYIEYLVKDECIVSADVDWNKVQNINKTVETILSFIEDRYGYKFKNKNWLSCYRVRTIQDAITDIKYIVVKTSKGLEFCTTKLNRDIVEI